MKTRIWILVLVLILSFVLFSCRKERPEPPTIEARDIKEFSPSVTDTITLYDYLPMLFRKDSIHYYHYKEQKRPFEEPEKGVRPVGVFRGYHQKDGWNFFVFCLNEKKNKYYNILRSDGKHFVFQTWLQEPSNKQEIVNIVTRNNQYKYDCYVDIYVLYVLQNGFDFYPLYYDKDIKIQH